MKKLVPILLAIVLLSACGKKEESATVQIAKLKKERAGIDAKIRALEAKSGMKDSAKPIPVTVLDVEPQRFQAYIDVQASIIGGEDVLATPQVGGTVRSVLVRTGQHVTKGQVLATLDAASVEQQIAAQDAQIGLLRSLYEKQQKLWAQQIGTEVQLLSAKANYEAAVKQRAALVAQRNMFRIVAPISGTVEIVSLQPGDIAAPGTIGIHVVNDTKLKAQASIGENYLGKVREGDPATVIIPELTDSIRAKISYVTHSVNPLSRAFTVEVNLGTNKRLHPNMSARMRIANYEADNTLVVPVSAVQRTGEGNIVFIENGKAAKAVPVQTGHSSDGLVEILSGLKPGDRVVTAGYEDLDTGTPIAVQ